jgi:hypothetical protein
MLQIGESDDARRSSEVKAGRVSWKRNLTASELLFDYLPDALEAVLGICAATASAEAEAGVAEFRPPDPRNADARQSVVQLRSFSGLRTAQMCVMRSPVTSNANTVKMAPSF